MRYRPSYEEYGEQARNGSVVPIYRQLIGDTLTPVSAFCKIQEGDWSFLFESVVGGERLGRYSFLGSGPFLKFQAFDPRVVLQEPGKPPAEGEHPHPLRLLEEKLAACRPPQGPGLPRLPGARCGCRSAPTSRRALTRRRSRSARSTSRPATCSRWCSASACRLRRGPGRSTSTARCGW